MFDDLEIHWTHPEEWDDETGDIYEDPNRILFYIGDFKDDNDIFRWYSKGYFQQGRNREDSPLLVVSYSYSEELNGLFDDYWKEPLKKWFINKFELPVKTVE
jgi:hypothetical protein